MMTARPASPPAASDDPALARRRRGRNVAMFLALLALALLFYAIAMVKMAHHGLGG
jgi:hypothetical protein